MRDGRVFEDTHYVRERVYLAQVADVGGLFQRVLADRADINVVDRSVRQLFRVVERGETVETIVRNLGHADMCFARIGGLAGQMRLGQDLEQRCLAYLDRKSTR